MSRRPPPYDDLPLFAGIESAADDPLDEGPSDRGEGRRRSKRRPRDLAESLPLFPEAAAEPEPQSRPGRSVHNLIYDRPMDDGDIADDGDDWTDEGDEPPFDVDPGGADPGGADPGGVTASDRYDEDLADRDTDDDESYEDDPESDELEAGSPHNGVAGHELPDVGDFLDDDLEDPYAAPIAANSSDHGGASGHADDYGHYDDYGVDATEGYATEGRPARISSRLLGGLADLAVHAAVLGILLIGNFLLGVAPDLESQWPPLLLFLLVFSFFYSVVPLAFWGQTPGMASLGLSARSLGGENLSFVQTTVRWLVALFTMALLGLPLLVALSGRSLGDRLSGSQTLEP